MDPSVDNLKMEKVWLDKSDYDNAERVYYERKAKGCGDSCKLTPLAGEPAKLRQKLVQSENSFEKVVAKQFAPSETKLNNAGKSLLWAQVWNDVEKHLQIAKKKSELFRQRIDELESHAGMGQMKAIATPAPKPDAAVADDDVDLFGSDSEEDDDAAAKVREERLAAYNTKKSNKPAKQFAPSETKLNDVKKLLQMVKKMSELFRQRIDEMESHAGMGQMKAIATPAPKPDAAVADDDVDLFGSDSEEDDDAAAKLREERLAAYNTKKSNKPAKQFAPSETKLNNVGKSLRMVKKKSELFRQRIDELKAHAGMGQMKAIATPAPKPDAAVADDDVDLFGSDSEEDDDAAAKLREERLAAYNTKKSNKPAKQFAPSETKLNNVGKSLRMVKKKSELFRQRIDELKAHAGMGQMKAIATPAPKPDAAVADDDVDLFGSDSEEDDDAAAKVREERLAAYNTKKSNKPARQFAPSETKLNDVKKLLQMMKKKNELIHQRIDELKAHAGMGQMKAIATPAPKPDAAVADDDVDLFGSDSEEDDDAAAKVREERLAAYNTKKSIHL